MVSVVGGVAAFSAGCLIAAAFQDKVRADAKAIVRWAIQYFLYLGFKALDPRVATERRLAFLARGAQVFSCQNRKGTQMDAVYIPAPADVRTGNVLVLCLNTMYQAHHPSRYEPFLKNGADIFLWNPTELGGIAYSEDLSDILFTLRSRNPSQVIALKTYCASSDPGIKAVAEQKDPNIHLIVDRGHGNVRGLIRSLTVLASLPLIQRVLRDSFDCRGIEKIKEVSGRTLFLTPEKVDQVMDYGENRNFTCDLHTASQNGSLIVLKESDHWSSWSYETYNETLRFLADIGVVSSNYKKAEEDHFPIPQPPTYFKEKCVPFLVKTCI